MGKLKRRDKSESSRRDFTTNSISRNFTSINSEIKKNNQERIILYLSNNNPGKIRRENFFYGLKVFKEFDFTPKNKTSDQKLNRNYGRLFDDRNSLSFANVCKSYKIINQAFKVYFLKSNLNKAVFKKSLKRKNDILCRISKLNYEVPEFIRIDGKVTDEIEEVVEIPTDMCRLCIQKNLTNKNPSVQKTVKIVNYGSAKYHSEKTTKYSVENTDVFSNIKLKNYLRAIIKNALTDLSYLQFDSDNKENRCPNRAFVSEKNLQSKINEIISSYYKDLNCSVYYLNIIENAYECVNNKVIDNGTLFNEIIQKEIEYFNNNMIKHENYKKKVCEFFNFKLSDSEIFKNNSDIFYNFTGNNISKSEKDTTESSLKNKFKSIQPYVNKNLEDNSIKYDQGNDFDGTISQSITSDVYNKNKYFIDRPSVKSNSERKLNDSIVKNIQPLMKDVKDFRQNSQKINSDNMIKKKCDKSIDCQCVNCKARNSKSSITDSLSKSRESVRNTLIKKDVKKCDKSIDCQCVNCKARNSKSSITDSLSISRESVRNTLIRKHFDRNKDSGRLDSVKYDDQPFIKDFKEFKNKNTDIIGTIKHGCTRESRCESVKSNESKNDFKNKTKFLDNRLIKCDCKDSQACNLLKYYKPIVKYSDEFQDSAKKVIGSNVIKYDSGKKKDFDRMKNKTKYVNQDMKTYQPKNCELINKDNVGKLKDSINQKKIDKNEVNDVMEIIQPYVKESEDCQEETDNDILSEEVIKQDCGQACDEMKTMQPLVRENEENKPRPIDVSNLVITHDCKEQSLIAKSNENPAETIIYKTKTEPPSITSKNIKQKKVYKVNKTVKAVENVVNKKVENSEEILQDKKVEKANELLEQKFEQFNQVKITIEIKILETQKSNELVEQHSVKSEELIENKKTVELIKNKSENSIKTPLIEVNDPEVVDEKLEIFNENLEIFQDEISLSPTDHTDVCRNSCTCLSTQDCVVSQSMIEQPALSILESTIIKNPCTNKTRRKSSENNQVSTIKSILKKPEDSQKSTVGDNKKVKSIHSIESENEQNKKKSIPPRRKVTKPKPFKHLNRPLIYCGKSYKDRCICDGSSTYRPTFCCGPLPAKINHIIPQRIIDLKKQMEDINKANNASQQQVNFNSETLETVETLDSNDEFNYETSYKKNSINQIEETSNSYGSE